jgi:hypothetical protein
MDETFLKDYANNVAMAQDPTGIAAIQAQPGFEGYVPSFSTIDQPMVNQNVNFAPTGGIDLPDLKNLAGNVLKEGVKEYVLKKAGLEGLKGNVLRGIVNPLGPIGLASFLPEPINPINALANLNTQVQSSLFGRSKTMSDYLAAKREQKAIQREEVRDLQQRIDVGQFGSNTPTPQDQGRTGQYSSSKSSGISKGDSGFESASKSPSGKGRQDY